ncbi:MAG TPA: trehalose-6-phosphate synthase [Candidatus Binatia bacterium]|nr:trehalose-6-phosphate synthase [Candidatus Binatia bacterium]
MAPRLIVVSNRAPVEFDRSGRLVRTVGGLASALADALRTRGGTWIAWVGPHAGDELPPDVTGLDFPIRAVRLKDREVNNYYAGFSNQVLWPLCHTFPSRCRFQSSYWTAYRQANDRFAATVQSVLRPRDLVWVHDFHLCLVPGLLRSGGVPARVGVFWHIPFPPPAVFGILRWRAEILGGLLGADVIGFQTASDARNFLESVAQFLGLRVTDEPPRVCLPGRTVRVVTLPIGIDHAEFRATAASPEVRERALRLRAALAVDVVMLGVDRLDYTKGIIERLQGYERFLERQGEWRRRVSLMQITVPSRHRVPEYRQMKHEIDEAVGRIIGRFSHDGRSPLQYRYTSLSREQLAAYYLAADVALVTPLRDGMNLVAKEYVACRRAAEGVPGLGGGGVLLLSEFAGAAQELREAVLVNPYDPEAIRRGLEISVCMPHDERVRRLDALDRRIAAHDLHWWTTSFLERLATPDREAATAA